MRRNGYDSYHGRNRLRTVLKVLIVLLVVVLIAGVAALVLLDGRMIYSAGGVDVNWPSLFQPQEEDPEPSFTLVIATPTASPTPEAEAEPAQFRGVLLGSTALYDGTVRQQLSAAGANAAIFDMKSDEGQLSYISSQSLAQDSQVSATDPAINAAIQLLTSQEDLYTVARLSCFRDNTVPRSDMSLAIPSSAGNWRDDESVRWLSPAVPEARAYVIGLCQELAGLGFDELVLDNCGFPNRGSTDLIRTGDRYDPESLTASMELFFQELDAALAAYPDVKVSVVTSADVLTGGTDGSGLTPQLLSQWADRVLVSVPEGQTLPTLDGVQVIPITAQAGGGDQSWAVLTASS